MSIYTSAILLVVPSLVLLDYWLQKSLHANVASFFFIV